MADTTTRKLIAEPEFGSLTTAFNALRNDLKNRGSLVHLDNNVTADATPVAADLPTSITLANNLKALLNTHMAKTDAHVAADATNTVVAANGTVLADTITLANAVKTAFNAHCAQAGVHINNDAGVIATANATILSDLITLLNAEQTALNGHYAKAATSTAIVRGVP